MLNHIMISKWHLSNLVVAFIILQSRNTQVEKVASIFPRALPNKNFLENLSYILKENGFSRKNTLVATSLCCDEVNRTLETELKKIYGDHFAMGGLAGFPFGGVSAFIDMAHHIPTNGHCLVIYGPHVGVDSNGIVGHVSPRDPSCRSLCCFSANAAASYVASVRKGVCQVHNDTIESLDVEQNFVGNLLLPFSHRLELAADPTKELPYALYDAQREFMDCIIARGCGEIGSTSKIALLGGIQINTPKGTPDYFVPIRFDILDNRGNVLADLSEKLLVDHSKVELYWLIALAICGSVLFYIYHF